MSEGRTASVPKGQEQEIDRYRIAREPFYAEVRGEVGLFTIARHCDYGERLVWRPAHPGVGIE